MTKENNSLGKFHLKGIAPMPRDAFEIDIDANGILNVSVQDESITISMRRDVCLGTQCECAKRTLSSWAPTAGILVSMSRQQFADCDTTGVGCNERLMDYTSVFAEKNASMTRFTGYKPDNASSGLKHWRNS